MELFTKYLPLEDQDIQENDIVSIIEYGRIIIRKVKTSNHRTISVFSDSNIEESISLTTYNKNDFKVKKVGLFICTREISEGDDIIYDIPKDYQLNGGKIRSIDGDRIVMENPLIFDRKDCFKIVEELKLEKIIKEEEKFVYL